MEFELNEDQRALRDSLARLLTDRYGFEARRGLAADAPGHDPQTWRHMGELGLLGLPVPEAHGGFGARAEDLLPVLQQLGAVLSLEPFLPLVLGATALRLAGDESQCADVLPRVAGGELRLAWAHDEADGRHAPWWVQTKARREGDGWVLDGAKSLVLGAPLADLIVVSARLAGKESEREGCALFLVDPKSPGVHVRGFRLVDDSVAGELTLSQAPAQPLGEAGDSERALAAIDGTLAMGIAAICADMSGAMQAAHSLAVDYLGTRQQFGRLIGQNQALRHRTAEMLVNLEMAKSMAIAAAVAVDAGDGGRSREASIDLHRAKLSVARNARNLAQLAIQLHGGIGMTEEYAVGHYLRRIHVLDQCLGDADAHAMQLAAKLAA
ncbi:acyl-CoA dehydrogenase family protein [Variovorax sp. J31P207]|uniref:acyl-CoA dehydrogenase family protein n=1 Tax=Variovorax sp. J31P207 TaxID=3053510 RepID=UPI0025751F02|nr:acyl-CoA dehydrogenase family protein [Variovorax sp. J31P207]MDM0066814.1 acyl-CoA dehydrogenase family protein [Variovorax sp. J31P207]